MMLDIKVIVLNDHEKHEFAAGALAFLIKNEAPGLRGKIRMIIRDLLNGHPKRFTGKALVN
ncbi:MAG: hypothetical protein ABI684_03810 [Nitrospirota bacterium]